MSALPETMRAVAINAYGGTEVLEQTTLPTPTLQHNHFDAMAVIVKVKAAGINPVDYKVRQGDMAAVLGLTFPAVLGIDYAGVVVAVGENVKSVKVGDEVYGKTGAIKGKGAYAEYIKVHTVEDIVVPRPDNITPEQAAGVGVVALTAYIGLVTYAGLSLFEEENKDKQVLVIGASGGVGIFAVQIAKLLGANVTAIASAKNKEFVTRELGADQFIDYTSSPLESQLTQPDQFDVIFDTVGMDEGKYWDLAQLIMKPHGLFVTSAGPTKGPVTITGLASFVATIAWRAVSNSRRFKFVSALSVDQFPNLATWIKEGGLKLFTTVTLPFEEVQKAHEMSASGRTVGKIVLTL
ncbi:hypothetical protein HDU98_001950 [Podochytrium sp. JEL0797]|nr:hypothetical protein HDU98_001950 [Podochytrium sp. JEL0797]